MGRINPITEEQLELARKKSAFSMPNNPSSAGWKAEDIRKSLYAPIFDKINSIFSWINDAILQANALFEKISKDIDFIYRVDIGNYYGTSGLIYRVYTGVQGGFAVTGCTNEIKEEVDIPSEIYYDGQYYTVTTIGNEAFKEQAIAQKITSVTIPKTVSQILSTPTNLAFTGCINLDKVTFFGNTNFNLTTFLSGDITFYVYDAYEELYRERLGERTIEVMRSVEFSVTQDYFDKYCGNSTYLLDEDTTEETVRITTAHIVTHGKGIKGNDLLISNNGDLFQFSSFVDGAEFQWVQYIMRLGARTEEQRQAMDSGITAELVEKLINL